MTFNQKEYVKNWYKKNEVRLKKKARKYYQNNKEEIKAKNRDYTLKNPERYSASRKRIRRRIMSSIFDKLGNKCELCKVANKIILQIDHIEGGGSKHFRKVAASIKGYYKEIAKSVENNEGKYRLLCANCNLSEAVRKGFRKSTWID